MDFHYSDEHEMFRKTARDFCAKEVAPLVEEAEEKEEFPKPLFQRMGELGFFSMSFPEEVGGQGLDHFFDMIFTEELARVSCGMCASMFIQLGLGTRPIERLGTPEQIDRYLRPALRGEKISAFALTEPHCGSDAASITTRAVKDGDEYVLTGSKTFITNTHIADYFLVVAYTDPSQRHTGIAFFIVDADAPGLVKGRRLRKMGNHAANTGEITLDNCRVSKTQLLGEQETGGFTTAMKGLVIGRILYGPRCLGVAKAAYEEALAYAKERETFGKPIIEHQMIQSKLARMATDIAVTEAFLEKVVWKWNQGVDVSLESSMVKLYASEMAQRVTWEAVQIFGGYGYMREFPVERYFRDARLLTIPEGTSEVHQMIIGKQLARSP